MTYDNTPKKMKKDKKLGLKLDKKTSQNMKTGALFRADNNNAFSSTFSGRFETIKTIANKRTPTTTPLLVNPTLRNPKHAAVLAESGIDYDSPVSPVQVMTTVGSSRSLILSLRSQPIEQTGSKPARRGLPRLPPRRPPPPPPR